MSEYSFLMMDWEIFDNLKPAPLIYDNSNISLILISYKTRAYNQCKSHLNALKQEENLNLSEKTILKFHNYTILNLYWRQEKYNKVIKYCSKVSKGESEQEILLALKVYLAFGTKLKFQNFLAKNKEFLSENESFIVRIEFYLLAIEYKIKYKKNGKYLEEYFDKLENLLKPGIIISSLGLLYYKTAFYVNKVEYYKMIKDNRNFIRYFKKYLKSVVKLKDENADFFFTLGKFVFKLLKVGRDENNNEVFTKLVNTFCENTRKDTIDILLVDYRYSLVKNYKLAKDYPDINHIQDVINRMTNTPFVDPHLIVKLYLNLIKIGLVKPESKISMLKDSIFYWKISEKRSIKLMKKIFEVLEAIYNEIGNSKKKKKFGFLKNLENLDEYFSWKETKKNFSSKIDKNLSVSLLSNYQNQIKPNFETIIKTDYFKNFKKSVSCIIKSYESEESFTSDLVFYQKLSPYGKYTIKLYGIENLHAYSIVFEGNHKPCSNSLENFFFLLPHRLLILFESLLTFKKNQIFIGKFSPNNIVIDSKDNIKFSFVDEIDSELRIVTEDNLKSVNLLLKNVTETEENYLAPELFSDYKNQGSYNIDFYKADIFAFGMILLELGYKNFNREQVQLKLNLKGYKVIREKIKNLKGCYWIKPLLRKMLKVNPEKRYSALDLIYMFRKRYQINIA